MILLRYIHILGVLLLLQSAIQASAQDSVAYPIKCDNNLWRYVYNHSRFVNGDNCNCDCIGIRGRIFDTNGDTGDGDWEINMVPAAGQDSCVYKSMSQSQSQGVITIEFVCQRQREFNDGQEAVKCLCKGYPSEQIYEQTLPEKLKHNTWVDVYGKRVQDNNGPNHHAVAEIHPVSYIIIYKDSTYSNIDTVLDFRIHPSESRPLIYPKK